MTQPRWGEKGNFSLLAGISLVTLVGFGAIVVDVGLLYWTKSRGEDTAQAAALAAVKDLNGTPAGLTAACNTAKSLINSNSRTNNEYGVVASCSSPFATNNEIQFGIWNSAQKTFTPGSSSNVLAINAVQVNLSRNSTKGNGVAPTLANVFTVFGAKVPSQLTVNTSAIASAVSGGAATGAQGIFPMAVSEAAFTKTDGSIACGREIILGDSVSCTRNPRDCYRDPGIDGHFNWTVGKSSSSFGTSDLRSCADKAIRCLEGETSYCDDHAVTVGSSIKIKGGGHSGFFNSSSSPFVDYMAEHGEVTLQVPIIDEDDDDFDRSGGSGHSCGGGEDDDDRGDGNGRVVGVGSIKFVEYKSKGSSKYLRGIVVCDQPTNNPGSTSAKSYGTEGRGRSAVVKCNK